jgi:membrane-bound inhibitor of C-type lysozyme
MSISFTKVTWYSQIAAIVLFVAVFCLGFTLGKKSGAAAAVSQIIAAATTVSTATDANAPIATATSTPKVIAGATYKCTTPAAGYISALYYSDRVHLVLSDGRAFFLPQAISASGARYANSDESFVFWNKGTGAFIAERGNQTYGNCATK